MLPVNTPIPTDPEMALLACPFCGSDDLLAGIQFGHPGIECKQCGAIGPRGVTEDSEDARDAWNTRQTLASASAAEWQDIASARRNGSSILVAYNPFDNPENGWAINVLCWLDGIGWAEPETESEHYATLWQPLPDEPPLPITESKEEVTFAAALEPKDPNHD